MKPNPSASVLAWLNEQPAETLYISSVTLAELLFGIATLPSGRRKLALTRTLEGLTELFDGWVLSFDINAARCYANLAATARAAGRGFPSPDGYIAAIAASQGYIVASRDTALFQAGGIKVINPWVR